jgi:hypothetical protein
VTPAEQLEPRDKSGQLPTTQDGAGARAGRGGDGRGGQGRRGAARRGRPLSVVRGSALGPPPSATAAQRWSPGPGVRGVPKGQVPRPEIRSSRRGWARPAGQETSAPGKLPRPLPLARPCPGPAPARPRGRVIAGAELPWVPPIRTPQTQHNADPQRWIGMSARGQGWKAPRA